MPLKFFIYDDTSTEIMLFQQAVTLWNASAEVVALEAYNQAVTYFETLSKREVSTHPNLIFIDRNEFHIAASGVELIHTIRSHQELDHIPVILWHNGWMEETLNWEEKWGKGEAILKPHTFEELQEKIQQLLSSYKIRQAQS